MQGQSLGELVEVDTKGVTSVEVVAVLEALTYVEAAAVLVVQAV